MTYDSNRDPGIGPDREVGRLRPDTDDVDGPARVWMLVVGVALLGAGLLGFVDNPIVGSNENALFHADTVHNIVHIATGLLALAIGATLHGRSLGQATIGFGILYAAVLVLTLVSPDLFGILAMPVNTADHGLHAVLAVGSLATGYAAMRDRAIA